MTFLQLLSELHDLEASSIGRLHGGYRPTNCARLGANGTAPQRPDAGGFQIHRQVAFSFACFGSPWSAFRWHSGASRETNVGIAIALVLVAVYYSFILVARRWTRGPSGAALIVWVPNLLFQTVARVLCGRTGGVKFQIPTSKFQKKIPNSKHQTSGKHQATMPNLSWNWSLELNLPLA